MNTVTMANLWAAFSVYLYCGGHWIGGTVCLAFIVLHMCD